MDFDEEKFFKNKYIRKTFKKIQVKIFQK